MKKILAGAFCAVSIIPCMAFAADIRGGEQVSVAGDEHVANDLYLGGSTVTSAATVTGDEIVVGGTVVVHGVVSQDLSVAGGTLTLLADVGDDLRAVGGNIIVSGKVGADAMLIGGEVQLSGASIGGDVYFAGGTLTINEPVNGNIHVRSGQLTINAPVKGNVYFTGDKLTLGSKGVVEGALTYSAHQEVSMAEGAKVVGKTSFEPQKKPESDHARAFFAIVLAAIFGKFLIILASALVLGLIFEKYAHTLVATATSSALHELARGFVLVVMIPLTSVILLSTVVGIPFGMLGLLMFAGLLILSAITVPILVGAYLYKYFTKGSEYIVSWKTILLGTVAYLALTFIPFLGWLIQTVLFLITLGTIAHIKWGVVKNWR